MLSYDAMTLGNHEFDFGVSSFVNNFVSNITADDGKLMFPILACNIKTNNETELEKIYQKSTIITKDGVKIGIIGYITPDTKFLSNSDSLEFENVLDSVMIESARLRNEAELRTEVLSLNVNLSYHTCIQLFCGFRWLSDAENDKIITSTTYTVYDIVSIFTVAFHSHLGCEEGCQFIIGLGHIGLEEDKILARQSDLDLIIGGHSHSLMWRNGSDTTGLDPDDINTVVDSYPAFETSSIHGRPVPVVQAFWSGKYLGVLHLQLNLVNESYVLNSVDDVNGEPILLDTSIGTVWSHIKSSTRTDPDIKVPFVFKQKTVADSEVEDELEKWFQPIRKFLEDTVAVSIERLGNEQCRQQECRLGNLITDIIVEYFAQVC